MRITPANASKTYYFLFLYYIKRSNYCQRFLKKTKTPSCDNESLRRGIDLYQLYTILSFLAIVSLYTATISFSFQF